MDSGTPREDRARARTFGGGAYARGFERKVPPAPGARRGFFGLGPRSYRRSDERIQDDCWQRLTEDPYVDPTEVELRVEQGEVVLTGSADSRRDKLLIEAICVRVPGVEDVRNELRVQRSG